MNKDSGWSDLSDLDAQLHEVKDLLRNVEQRLHQVHQAAIAKTDLLRQQQQVKQELQAQTAKMRRNAADQQVLKQELSQQLQEIGDRLEQIELDLESRLISWSSLREIFWQIVRFVGLGIIIGIILRSCAG